MLHIFGYIGAFVLISFRIIEAGSILSMPILVYLFKFNAVTASAYSLFIVGVTALLVHLKILQKNNQLSNNNTIFSIGSYFSIRNRKYLIALIPEVILSNNFIIVRKDQLIMILFGILMLAAGYFMIKKPENYYEI